VAHSPTKQRYDDDGYALPPERAPDLAECSFYQTIELPGLGVQRGQWDLRANIANYLGGISVFNRRVLEIGTANGFVSFELERRGGRVVSFDLDENLTYDAPPYSEAFLRTDQYRDGLRRIRNAYWLAHGLLGSRARVAYGHANKLPAFLGRFDVGVIANVLQHLRDPIGAVLELARICDRVVVTETDWMPGHHDDLNGMVLFDHPTPYSWYQVKPPLVETVLSRMGFGNFQRTSHTQRLLQDCVHTDEAGPVTRAHALDVVHFTITSELVDRSRYAA
jgi:SAM-dependent methyltransferase